MKTIFHKKITRLSLVFFLFFFLDSNFCSGQSRLEDMNKKELRQLTDFLILKSDSLQLRINKLEDDNLKINSALEDSILSINKLNISIETKNKTINKKESELLELNNNLNNLNDSLKIAISTYNNIKNKIVELQLENKNLKDSVIDLCFKLQIANQYKEENILIEEKNSHEIIEPAEGTTNHKIQKYAGTYPFGKVTYNYFDDEHGNRVYDGPFYYCTLENESYNWKNRFGLNNYEEIEGNPFCKGNYSLNKKTGSWAFGTVPSYGKSDTIYAAYGNFKNDLPSGTFHFIYNNQYLKNKRIFDFYVNYINGIPTGKVNFKCAGNDNMRLDGEGGSKTIKSLEINGNLSSLGEPIGDWIVKYQLGTFLYLRKDFYLKGTLIKSELKDFATGELLFSQDFSSNFKTNPKNGIEYFSENFEGNPYFIDKLLEFLNGAAPSEESNENYSLSNIFPNSLIWMGKM